MCQCQRLTASRLGPRVNVDQSGPNTSRTKRIKEKLNIHTLWPLCRHYFSIRRRRRIPKTNSTDAFPEDETKPPKTNCPPTSSSLPEDELPTEDELPHGDECRRCIPRRRIAPRRQTRKRNSQTDSSPKRNSPNMSSPHEDYFRRQIPEDELPPPKMKISRILKTSSAPKTNCPMKTNSYILPQTCHPRIVLRTAVDDS